MTETMADAELMEVGYLAGAHGLRGEIRAHLHWDESEALERVEVLWVAKVRGEVAPSVRRKLKIYGARRTPQGYLLSLEGVDDKTAADALKGSSLYVERSALPALEPGEYYLSDLLGFEVWSAGSCVGSVVDLRLHPSVDCVVVETPDGRRMEQPLLEPWLERVDVEARRVVLFSLDGVIE